VGPGLCRMSGFFGFFGFRVKIFSPCSARQSYRVKNFDPSPPIKLFGSGRVRLFSGGLGRVRRVGQPMPRSTVGGGGGVSPLLGGMAREQRSATATDGGSGGWWPRGRRV